MPTKAQHVLGEGGIFLRYKKITKEKSLCKMMNMVLWTPLASVLLAISL